MQRNPAAVEDIVKHEDHFSCFSGLIGNSFLADIKLRTKEGTIHHAHKVILAAVSPTLKMMFSDVSFSESTSDMIDVPYEWESCFETVLRYIYTGEVPPLRDAVAVLEAAAYYQLGHLKSAAVIHLCKSTTEENTFERLNLALSFGCAGLREHCLMMIRQYNTEVIHSPDWLSLPLEVALLLVQETVIEGELTILKRCYEWCVTNVKEKDLESVFLRFLAFVDFTQMTEAEVEQVEKMQCVPLGVMYQAFKRHSLEMAPAHTARNGGIVLQWEMSMANEGVSVINNHVCKIAADSTPRTVCAINKFNKGRHYWTVRIQDLRVPHDCLVGVVHRGQDALYAFEPCCMQLSLPAGTNSEKEEAAGPSILIEHGCEVGVMLDYNDNCIKWYNHLTKALLFTARPVDGKLPAPMCPCVQLFQKNNGGATLSECTTYPAARCPKGEKSKLLKLSPSKAPRTAARPTPSRRTPIN